MNRNNNPYLTRVNEPIRFKLPQSNLHHQGISEERYITNPDRRIDFSKEKENDKINNLARKSKRTIHQEDPKRNLINNGPTFKGMMKTQVTIPSNLQNTQPTEQRRVRQKKQKQVRIEHKQPKEIGRVSSGISIGGKMQISQTKITQIKMQMKNEDPKKNSYKRNVAQVATLKSRRTKQKQPSPQQFLCDEEFQVIQPKSTRIETQKSRPTLFKSNIIVAPTKQGYEQQILQFQQIQANINLTECANQVVHIGSRELNYTPDPNYIEKKQKHFNWFMRSILIEWMMHVSFQYKLKRDTFHLAVCLSDLYFSKVLHIPKAQLQLVGAAAMYLSAKIQQRQPLSVVKFAESTSGKYQPKSILDMQSKIVKNMKWQLNPPTVSMWANKIMQQWDLFLEESDYARKHPLKQQQKLVFFKKANKESYLLFLSVMQILDCCILQIQSFQYKQKPLVCSIIYLVLKISLDQVQTKKILFQYPRVSNFILDQQNLLNDLFRAFVQHTFGFLLYDLLPTIQYCSTFFGLQLVFEMDECTANEIKEKNFQQYSSYQTYNCHSLSWIKRRTRGIIQGIYAQ